MTKVNLAACQELLLENMVESKYHFNLHQENRKELEKCAWLILSRGQMIVGQMWVALIHGAKKIRAEWKNIY